MYCKGCISFNFSIFFIIYTTYRKNKKITLPYSKNKKIQFFFIIHTFYSKNKKITRIYSKKNKITRLDGFFVHDLHFSLPEGLWAMTWYEAGRHRLIFSLSLSVSLAQKSPFPSRSKKTAEKGTARTRPKTFCPREFLDSKPKDCLQVLKLSARPGIQNGHTSV